MVMTTPHRPPTDVRVPAIAVEIAGQLGENEIDARRQITRALRVIGEERTRAFVAQALTVEAAGGMMLKSGSRRHTPGGVFFRLMRDELMRDADGRQAAYRIFRPQGSGRGGPQAPKQPKAPREVAPFDWTTVSASAAEAMEQPGRVSVKTTLVGTVGKVIERGDVVFVGMTSETVPSLPKGVPVPAGGGRFLAMVSAKQWTKIAAALTADPNDKVIAEGYPSIQDGFKGISVSVTSITTARMQAGKRAAQQTAVQPAATSD